MKSLKETYQEVSESTLKYKKEFKTKLDDIDKRHKEERDSLGIEPYSKESSDLWKKKYQKEFISLKKEFGEDLYQ